MNRKGEREEAGDAGKKAVRLALDALGRVCAQLPHLSGLAGVVEFQFDSVHARTACVTPSGLILINPDWFPTLSKGDAAFVVAHELMHLALEHHSRRGDVDPLLSNMAEDYIINDTLAEEMDRRPPEGALHFPGARHYSVERMLLEMLKRREKPGINSLANAFAGLEPEEDPVFRQAGGLPLSGDVIDGATEDLWFPQRWEEASKRRQRVLEKVSEIEDLRDTLERVEEVVSLGAEGQDRWAGTWRAEIAMEETAYLPPWELALQESLEAARPPTRTYSRMSRRNPGHDPNLVLPGRQRQSDWALVIVLDTSGSMESVLPPILGCIARFCECHGVQRVRILQCDAQVHKDEWIDPEDLRSFEVDGFGGSDMAPAMDLLAGDPEVQAVVVITDGWIDYPREPMPYQVIWTLYGDYLFEPPYGTVVRVNPDQAGS